MEKTSINNIKFIDRLEEFMISKGLNNNMLTDKAGLSNGLIGKARKKRSEMNSESIERILLTYPELNADWLLTGRGEMTLKSDLSTLQNENLTFHLKEEIKEMKEEIKELRNNNISLIEENSSLKTKLELYHGYDSSKAG